MNAKKYLEQIGELEDAITRNEEEIIKLRASADSIGSFDYSKPVVKSSGSKEANYAHIIERIDILERKNAAAIAEAAELRSCIIAEINTLGNAVYSQLLYGRYVKRMSFQALAKKMHYDYNYLVTRLHPCALKHFAEKVDCKRL